MFTNNSDRNAKYNMLTQEEAGSFCIKWHRKSHTLKFPIIGYSTYNGMNVNPISKELAIIDKIPETPVERFGLLML
jgi:hypothetical protein